MKRFFRALAEYIQDLSDCYCQVFGNYYQD